MLTLKAQLDKLPPADRPHVIRVTRSVLNKTLLDLLNDRTDNNAIRRSVGASLLASAIESLNEFPEADDNFPMHRQVQYTAE